MNIAAMVPDKTEDQPQKVKKFHKMSIYHEAPFIHPFNQFLKVLPAVINSRSIVPLKLSGMPKTDQIK